MKNIFVAMSILVSPLLVANPQVFDSTELTKYLEVCAIDSKYLTTEQKIRGAELTEKLEVAISHTNVKLINPPKVSVMKKCMENLIMENLIMENLMQEVEKNGN